MTPWSTGQPNPTASTSRDPFPGRGLTAVSVFCFFPLNTAVVVLVVVVRKGVAHYAAPRRSSGGTSVRHSRIANRRAIPVIALFGWPVFWSSRLYVAFAVSSLRIHIQAASTSSARRRPRPAFSSGPVRRRSPDWLTRGAKPRYAAT